jgi:solute carrier family 25 carnitine/acylcarnitine transporter 20/29
MQVQTSGAGGYASTWDCLKKIASQHGLRGVYQGQTVTVLREWQGD